MLIKIKKIFENGTLRCKTKVRRIERMREAAQPSRIERKREGWALQEG